MLAVGNILLLMRRSLSGAAVRGAVAAPPVDDKAVVSFWKGSEAAAFERRSVTNGRVQVIDYVVTLAAKHIANLTRPPLIVDLACGTGLWAKRLRVYQQQQQQQQQHHEQGQGRWVGVDISESHLAEAANHMDEVVLADLRTWEPKLGCAGVDLAIHNNCIEDYTSADKEIFVKRVSSYLAPGGAFILQMYSPDDEPMGQRYV